jgi:alpha-1,3-fucosyltransferase
MFLGIVMRKRLVRRLKKFIDVSSYGTCGNLICPRVEGRCDEMINSTYKFYLAFENSICPDYVTEKVFKVMNRFIIPVVLNGANMTNFLPPKSYINANEFDTIEALAKYLQFLSDNPAEYVKYFWWREHYTVQKKRMDLCEICEKINDKKLLANGKRFNNFASWHSYSQCSKPRIQQA